MEQTWLVPCDDYWSMDPDAWVPGLHAAIEMSCFQTLVPSSPGGQQLVVYEAAAAPNYDSPIRVFEKSARGFGDDIDMIETKIHRYPESILISLPKRYTVPLVVAIGPYHHELRHLKPAEKAKHLAAYHCIRDSGRSVQEMYDAVVSVSHVARGLYVRDSVAGIPDDDFLPMMFYDACFLVQYMISCIQPPDVEMDPWLLSFISSNDLDIYNDIMLLENQVPWVVLETLVSLVRPALAEEFIAWMKDDQKNDVDLDSKYFSWETSYTPPHLLGLSRYYMIQASARAPFSSEAKLKQQIQFSVSAIELAEMGIQLRRSKTAGLMDISIKRGLVYGELCLPPMTLDEPTAAWLVNLAAFELCTNSDFFDEVDDDEKTAVCSYLLLLAMFVDREEDVQQLRTKRLLTSGRGLTNKEALDFFTSISKHLRHGPCYRDVMVKIEKYKQDRWLWVMVHRFVYNNMKTIVTVFTAIGGLLGIIGALRDLKKS